MGSYVLLFMLFTLTISGVVAPTMYSDGGDCQRQKQENYTVNLDLIAPLVARSINGPIS
jgi:hypothetical protein